MPRPAKKTVRRGPGRPRKTATATPARRSPGRPRKTEAAPARRGPGRPPKKALSPAATALSAHGLGRWKPKPGDLLITESAGSFTLGKKSWRKAADAYRPDTGVAQPQLIDIDDAEDMSH